MDGEPEEVQFLGFFGIYKEACNLILSWRKIFTQITLSLILPLSFIFLAHIQISDLLFTQISQNEAALETIRPGTPSEDHIIYLLSSEWTTFLIFKAFYLLLVLIFSLLSTSAVVYAVASIYTAKDLPYRKVMSIVPVVWKRLMITFLWNFVILLGYNVLTGLAAAMLLVSVAIGFPVLVVVPLLVILAVGYVVGVVYISVVWHLACVISVLEDARGLQAMQKSKELIKGKMFLASLLLISINLAMAALHMGFARLVVYGGSFGVGVRMISAVVFFGLLSGLVLMALVIQTIVYFVCKAYHHESVDKSCLSEHLDVYYLGEYEPLKDKSLPLEQFHL